MLAAQDPRQPEAAEALAQLCHNYWYPLYAFVRRRGHGPEEAKDLTQEFFARLVGKDTLQVADPQRGRFRSFLLAALGNFLNNEWDRARTLKRGAGHEVISWDSQSADERYSREPFHEETPEREYERRWAFTVLAQAMTELREEYTSAGKEPLFEALQACLSGGRAEEPYAELARRLNMNEGALKVAVHRLRQRFGVTLRQAVTRTLGSGEDVEAELKHLISMLS